MALHWQFPLNHRLCIGRWSIWATSFRNLIAERNGKHMRSTLCWPTKTKIQQFFIPSNKKVSVACPDWSTVNETSQPVGLMWAL